MARKYQPPSSLPEPPPRKLLSRWDLILLIICLFILVSVGLRECGFDMVKRVEKTELKDKPHQ